MSDLLILISVLGGLTVVLWAAVIWGQRGQSHDAKEWRAELRALQLESARLTLQNRRDSRRFHEELKAYLKSAGIRLDQIFERVDHH
jgi:hypothetical protein